jgi:ATP-dependent Clp protease adaptor protein ClpS
MMKHSECQCSISRIKRQLSPGNEYLRYARINITLTGNSMGNNKEKYNQQTEEHTELKTGKPSLYNVFLLNDDYTSMEFVVDILEGIFRKNRMEATQIMLHVHKKGVGLAGVYPREIAETKVETVHRIARESEFPLKCIMEKKSD